MMSPGDDETGRLSDVASLTRGFLFADLRGFTEYLESHGATATAELLGRYRTLVRDEISRYRGAEIKTEGDSFYVVFTAVSAAVQCGLAIAEDAGRASAERPDQPIHVGIGIHAGETVQSDGGYVGSAVNIAARTCAQARPGEVLVTDTVRALTKTVLPVDFAARGRRQLKGVAEPIALYAARPLAGGRFIPARHGRARRPSILAAVGVALVAAASGAAWMVVQGGAANKPAPPAAGLPAGAEMPAAPYSPRFTPAFTLDPDAGWVLYLDEPDAFAMVNDGTDEAAGSMAVVRLQAVYRDQCRSSGTRRIDGTVGGVMEWLENHPYLLATADPYPVSIGSASGLEVGMDVRDLEPCPDDPFPAVRPRVYLFPTAGEPFTVGEEEQLRVRVVDVGGQAVAVVLRGTPPFMSRVTRTLDTIRFDAHATLD